jgi:hypothetical protein
MPKRHVSPVIASRPENESCQRTVLDVMRAKMYMPVVLEANAARAIRPQLGARLFLIMPSRRSFHSRALIHVPSATHVIRSEWTRRSFGARTVLGVTRAMMFIVASSARSVAIATMKNPFLAECYLTTT